MDRSPAHEAARVAACRVPALTASLALLVKVSVNASIALYGTERPVAGEAAGGAALVTIPLADAAGTVNAELFQIQLTVPIEAQITDADPVTGTTALWARITDGSGAWWGDASVSNEAGSGEIKLQITVLYNGAFCRLTSAIFQG